MKIHLCRRFKFEVMGMSQGRYPVDIFSEIFEDAHRTILWNSKNMQQLTFYYFMQHIWWSKIENNTRVMWFVMYFQIDVLGTSLDRHFWTLLRCPWDISSQFMRKLINLIVFASWWYAESTSIRGFLTGALGCSSKVLLIQRTVVLLVFRWIKIENRDVAIHS